MDISMDKGVNGIETGILLQRALALRAGYLWGRYVVK
jgi:hypothetical protein